MAIRTGTKGNDELTGTTGADHITGGEGNDRLLGRYGDDVLDGGIGDDTLFGGAGDDRLNGGSGTDRLYGGDGSDTMERDWGFLPPHLFVLDLNLALGTQGALFGGDPNDVSHFAGIENYTSIGLVSGRFTGNDGANIIRSDRGRDTLLGNGGDDQLFSGSSRDRLDGGAGDDALNGGDGRDRLTGGAGNDAFHFAASYQGGDRITDFTGGVGNDDALYLTAAGFGGLPLGQLDPERFVARGDNQAQDGNDRFIFDTVRTELWYDRNGDRAGGLTLLADLQAGAVVTAGDIFLI